VALKTERIIFFGVLIEKVISKVAKLTRQIMKIIDIRLAWCACVNSSNSFKKPLRNALKAIPKGINTMYKKSKLFKKNINGLIKKRSPDMKIITAINKE